jgi:hypothetical protein
MTGRGNEERIDLSDRSESEKEDMEGEEETAEVTTRRALLK